MSWLKFFSSLLNTFVKHTHPKTRENKIWAQDKTDPQGVGRTETISLVTFECQYRNILESLNLSQNITKPTRVTHTMKSLIDHIISNYPLRVAHTDVLSAPSVSNHDTVYMIINVWVTRYAPHHKYIRNEKQLDMLLFKQDFLSLPLNVIYGLKSPDDMVDALNSFVTECLDHHTPLKKVKVTRPPTSWMASNEILRELQTTRDKLRAQASCRSTDETWTVFRTAFRNCHRKG